MSLQVFGLGDRGRFSDDLLHFFGRKMKGPEEVGFREDITASNDVSVDEVSDLLSTKCLEDGDGIDTGTLDAIMEVVSAWVVP